MTSEIVENAPDTLPKHFAFVITFEENSNEPNVSIVSFFFYEKKFTADAYNCTELL